MTNETLEADRAHGRAVDDAYNRGFADGKKDAAPVTCEQCENWKERYFCKSVFHPTKASDTCKTVLSARRKGGA